MKKTSADKDVVVGSAVENEKVSPTFSDQKKTHQFKLERRYDTLAFSAVCVATVVSIIATIVIVFAFIAFLLMDGEVPVGLQRALSYVVSVILGGLIGAAFMRNRK